MSQQEKVWESRYNSASQESLLLWHNEEIPAFLTRAVELLGGKGNALDIGCGTGVYAAYMAQKGLQVTALDFASRALEFARKRADKFGVNINFVQADVVDWKTSSKYELIFDSGCLHSLKGRDRTRYKEQILSWVSNQGSYILIHCGRKYFITLNLRCPIRKTPQEIERFFLPEFNLKEIYHQTDRSSTLFHYWFSHG